MCAESTLCFLSSGCVVAYPDMTPTFEFCPCRRSLRHRGVAREIIVGTNITATHLSKDWIEIFEEGFEAERSHTMAYSISTLLTRNLQEVFGENDPARRRAAIDELYTEDGVFYDPSKGVYRGREEIDRIAGAIKATHPDF